VNCTTVRWPIGDENTRTALASNLGPGAAEADQVRNRTLSTHFRGKALSDLNLDLRENLNSAKPWDTDRNFFPRPGFPVTTVQNLNSISVERGTGLEPVTLYLGKFTHASAPVRLGRHSEFKSTSRRDAVSDPARSFPCWIGPRIGAQRPHDLTRTRAPMRGR
jgi:hypothetical protein